MSKPTPIKGPGRANFRNQLNNIDIQNEDGTITNLGEKYGNKEAN